MSVTLKQNAIMLAANCGAEEAETLLALLHAHPNMPVDITAVEWAHTALWQVILAFAPPIRGTPSHEFIRQRLLPLITNSKPDTTVT
jgi:hypothetical protein